MKAITLAGVGLCLAVPGAAADAPRATPSRIEVDRDDAPAGRTELGFDSGAPVRGWGVTLSGAWLEEPIAIVDAESGTAVTYPVARRHTVRLGGAYALGSSVVLDARLPVARQTGSRLRAFGDARPLDRQVLGDLALGARIRVAQGGAGAVFVRGDLTLPTGADADFAGEARWSLAWRLIGRAQLPASIALAGSLGIRLRGAEILVGDRLVGDELAGAFGAVVPLPAVRPLWSGDQLSATAEVAAILGNDVGAGAGPSPVEVRGGLLARPHRQWTLAARLGCGVNDQIGSPRLRAMLELTFQPPLPTDSFDR